MTVIIVIIKKLAKSISVIDTHIYKYTDGYSHQALLQFCYYSFQSDKHTANCVQGGPWVSLNVVIERWWCRWSTTHVSTEASLRLTESFRVH